MSDGVAVHIGDPQRRVTVAFPGSIAELKAIAQRKFPSYQPKLYQHGIRELHHPSHIKHVEHDDIIVVPPGDFEKLLPLMQTTHQDHFVKHPLPDRQPRKAEPRELDTTPFDGNTSYNMDYVRHPLGDRHQPRQQKRWEPGPRQPIGESIYSTHYPWRDVLPRAPAKMPDTAYTPSPFDATTSYAMDYVPYKMRPKSAGKKKQEPLKPSPFEGVSTYNVDFTGKQGQRPAAGRPVQDLQPYVKFDGTSEYKKEYVEKELARMRIVHLEPEIELRHTGVPYTTKGGGGVGGIPMPRSGGSRDRSSRSTPSRTSSRR
mmetsp:Transcript_42972/g.93559  ORF Transcript_42972/g.93559 Transcript_42972/m.93559 type:complete len:315 (-) Transcript_42972:205-1149(-)